jgi:acyl-coenzyme A thioesterase PaaI-like protein
VKSGTIEAEGRLVKLGRRNSYTEGFVRDGAGNLAVHATATFSMIGGQEKGEIEADFRSGSCYYMTTDM